MTASERRVTEALGQVMFAWFTARQALEAEAVQLALFASAGSMHGPLSPQAEQAAAAYRVSTEQRAAAMELHKKAGEELLQALEALRREGSN